jgi:hypothetical protein
MWKLILALSTALLAAGGLAMTIRNNSTRITSVEATAIINRESTIGIKKDIERLNEKIGEVNVSQEALRSEQKEAFREIFKRLPN